MESIENNKLLKHYKDRIKWLKKNIELSKEELKQSVDNRNIYWVQSDVDDILKLKVQLTECEYEYGITKSYFEDLFELNLKSLNKKSGWLERQEKFYSYPCEWMPHPETITKIYCGVCNKRVDYKTDYCPHCGSHNYKNNILGDCEGE